MEKTISLSFIVPTGMFWGWVFFTGFVLVIFVTAMSARFGQINEAPEQEASNHDFDLWFKEVERQAYLDGYSSSAVENFSKEAFMDYWEEELIPSQAINEYFSKE